MRDAIVLWDDDDDPDGNVAHVARHDLTPEEVEAALADPESLADSDSSGRPVAFGWTDSGRYILVVYEVQELDPLMIYPITAYDVEPPEDGP